MDRAGKRCVIYSRVSTEMQVDGFSLAAQKTCLTTFAKREELRIVGEYEDAGKSGKSIEGRPSFKRMINDIKSGLNIDYVVVYKLSRFGRNAADVLNSLELIQDYGVNLICTDEGIDSSQASGRLLISVLSAVAQIERENILEQTMNGRREKARQGLWNGGQAPYGYKLVGGKLEIDEEEAEIIKKIFEEYIDTPITMSGVATKLNQMGAVRRARGNSIGDYWCASTIRKIIGNPIYIGKIRWGVRQNRKVKGSKELKRVYTTENVIYSDGVQKPIISDEIWEKAQNKRMANPMKNSKPISERKIHPFTGIITCPVCGEPMTSTVSISRHNDGTVVPRYGYSCKIAKGQHRLKHCDHHISYSELAIEYLVKQAISETLNNKTFIEDLKNEFSGNKNNNLLNEELEAYKKKLRSLNMNKVSLENQIDNMDYDEPNYDKRREDLNNRLNTIYNNIYDLEDIIDETKQKIEALNSEVLSADVIIKVLQNFSKFYDLLADAEKQQLIRLLIKKIVPVKLDFNSSCIMLDRIEFNFPIFKNIKLISNIKNTAYDKINLNEIPAEAIISNVSKTVEYGDNENKIKISPYELTLRTRFTTKKLNDYDQSYSNQIVNKYINQNYWFIIGKRLMRFVKKKLGIKYRLSNVDNPSEEIPSISVYQWDALVDAFNYFNMIPDEIKANLDEIKEGINFIQNVRYDEMTGKIVKIPKFVDVIKFIKENYGFGCSSNSIRAALNIIGLSTDDGIRSYPREPVTRSIVESLIKLDKIDNRSYESEITTFYKNRKKKGRPLMCKIAN